MYCRYCGAKIQNNAIFCPKCGKKLPRISGTDNTYSPEDWARLVNEFAGSSGDQKNAAFEKLYKASYKTLYAHVQKYARNQQATEDAVQSAYIICFDKIDQLDNPANFIPWMKQIAYNEFLKTIRKNSREVMTEPVTDDEGSETDPIDLTPDDTMLLPEDAYANEELQNLLLQSINELSENQRIIIKGYYFDGKQISDLAVELGMPVNSVKTNLSRGRKNLEKKASSYANAYGLKLVPLALVPFLAILAKKDVLACEATAAGGAAVLAAVKKAAAAKAAGTVASGAAGSSTGTASGGAGSAAGASAAGTGGTTAGASTAGAESATSAAAHTIGTSVAVKAGIGITAAAVALGGPGVYLHSRNVAETNSIVTDEPVEETDNQKNVEETFKQEPEETIPDNPVPVVFSAEKIIAANNHALINQARITDPLIRGLVSVYNNGFDPIDYVELTNDYLYSDRPVSRTVTYSSDDPDVQLTRRIDNYTYDEVGNITECTVTGAINSGTFAYTYDDHGNLLTRELIQGESEDDPISISYEYDGDQIVSMDISQGTKGLNYSNEVTYDEDGYLSTSFESFNYDPCSYIYEGRHLDHVDNTWGLIGNITIFNISTDENEKISSVTYRGMDGDADYYTYDFTYSPNGLVENCHFEVTYPGEQYHYSFDVVYDYE